MRSNKPFLIFSAKLLGAYGAWVLLHSWLESSLPAWWLAVKDWTAATTVRFAAWMAAHIFMLDVTFNSRNVLMAGTSGVFLADHCLAIPACVVFALFIIIYSGRWQDKVWFIPMGILLIFFINSLRIAALTFIQKYYSERFFQFAHSYVYLVITYGLIFLLIVWWVEVFAPHTGKHGPTTTPQTGS